MPDRARRLIAGNWKMNMLRAEGRALATTIAAAGPFGCDVVLCPPATLVGDIAAAVAGSGVTVAGQDCHQAASGAHTGDISAAMLVDLGCSHVIVGHSERRLNHGEHSTTVRAKAEAALAAGLIPIICIGETEAERDAGEMEAVLSRQLAESVPPGMAGADIVVAYEPVWAIGTGRTATPDQVADAHAHIRARLDGLTRNAALVPLLYGGSVKPDNVGGLMTVADVDGALVGGASLTATDFLAIVTA